MDHNKFYLYIQILIGVLTAAGLLYKFLTPWIIKMKKSAEKKLKIQSMIECIFKELTPNGGASIKDKILKIEKQLDENTEMTSLIVTKQKWMLNTRTEPIFEANVDGKIVWLNRAYLDLVKRPVDEVLDHGWKNILHIEDKEEVETEWEKCIRENRSFEKTFKIVDINENVYSVRCVAQKTSSVEFGGYMGFFQNVKKIDI